jgi:hypothetical protein
LKIKKIGLGIGVLLFSVVCSLTAYGTLFPTSNLVNVSAGYNVVLSETVTDSQVALKAVVTNNGEPVRAGLNVDFYVSTDGTVTWYNFASVITDSDGIAQTTYVIVYNGSYDFKAVVTIP